MENNLGTELLELNEMREQMHILKEDLDKQIQANEELMMQKLKKSSNAIRTNGTEVLVFALLAIYPAIVYSRMYGLTKILTIVSIIVMLLDGIYSYWVTHLVKDNDLSDGHVSDMLETMLKVKRITRTGTTIEIVVCIALVLWICYKQYSDLVSHCLLNQHKLE